MSIPAPPRRRFSKMHGAGNDFVVLDLRDGAPPPTPAEAARMADRHRGIGFDQLLTIEPPANFLASTRCSSGKPASPKSSARVNFMPLT